MMTRKHFRALALAISKIEKKSTREELCEQMVDFCRNENPRFDSYIFRTACGVDTD